MEYLSIHFKDREYEKMLDGAYQPQRITGQLIQNYLITVVKSCVKLKVKVTQCNPNYATV